ncbi:MAG TPA: sigma-70 family RNA polymerase sigma factor [Candidatus Dormibacteraeota bacterium]|jgi:RNA polymerase sigma-70 factor (ECF subfamily)|nr:sigma-70 family RNA polymerase sigma factor [Candidatus Dormibacteraeota bacterium]
MTDDERLAERFEEQRGRLRAVAYRMLGSMSEADDAVQETWLRLGRVDAAEIENLGGWLTTVIGRICLNMLRSRTTRREDPLDGYVPDPIVDPPSGIDPEHEVLLADSVGLALLIVLEMLSPAERLAFVLHDMFGVPFEEIADILQRSPAATRQLASRARRRVHGATPPPSDLNRQREVVDAFFAAARGGSMVELVALLDPDVVLRSDSGTKSGARILMRGAEKVAGSALIFRDSSREVLPALVNGGAGVVITSRGRPIVIMGFTISEGRVVAISGLGDLRRIARVDLSFLEA